MHHHRSPSSPVQEAARRTIAVRELEGATFRPQLAPESRAGAYSHVKPHLNLKQPEAYMAQVCVVWVG